MARYSVDEFVEATAQKDTSTGTFELESEYLVEVRVDDLVWAKLGTMIGYFGEITFTREGALEHGVGKFMKKMVTGEGAALMKIEGNGRVYLADQKKKISVLTLDDDTFYVNGNDLLALENSVDWDITMMRRLSSMAAGGLFNVQLSGSGNVAITTHADPFTLRVTPERPIRTDPSSTVAWSGALTPEITTDVSLKTFFGRGSGESVQLEFKGHGWVVLQPYEEGYAQRTQ